jgi:NAD(P)-dependent dehydrogenase (short-subunit alcohol dehydrogenase family)
MTGRLKGKAIMQDSDALAVDLSVFDRTLQINLRGHLLCTRAVLPHLLQRGGAIVYTTSGACDAAEPQRPSYAASKSGLNALMRHVALIYTGLLLMLPPKQ